MKRLISLIAPTANFLLFVLLLYGVAFVIVGGVAFGLGYLLMRIFPFSLFEATVLSTLFGAIAVYVATKILNASLPPAPSLRPADISEEEEEDADDEYSLIPTSRFYATESERTWEAWLRAQTANDIYIEFQDEEYLFPNLDDAQVQEVAIRLSDAIVAVIKRKSGAGRRLSISVADVKREMAKSGLRAYDNDIMTAAVSVVNMNLAFHFPVILDIIRRRAWNEPAQTPGN